ncbi:DUF2277 domain-containing protein [Pseudobacteriovorax antillogorgiicola]|uniref:DUF2277 domain-containing protein n=1 Tax=Pseudobacteriovorax antillogorgiicola TaxID=1513793 RepID=A0A1Y6BH51_9BACT|nr:DUF2277 domain-containing protein [Pseudobacteriovorax antillogorgiicola]TCS56191.1 hypothetical protein EDD56_10413 [Pseudobacteriovorax antillogorgiicola]SMF08820.1 hypothetical protein SAMN06296036_104321 [Pseudobacteriovorax antillogorgiicola]
MCGNIKRLRFVDRKASDEEIQKAALQYVRKIGDYKNSSDANNQAFDEAVKAVSKSLKKMLDNLTVRDISSAKR